MNTVISNLTYLLTGSSSEYHTKELKPYLMFFLISLFGVLGLKIVKILLVTL
jgi:hypothetical protein